MHAEDKFPLVERIKISNIKNKRVTFPACVIWAAKTPRLHNKVGDVRVFDLDGVLGCKCQVPTKI